MKTVEKLRGLSLFKRRSKEDHDSPLAPCFSPASITSIAHVFVLPAVIFRGRRRSKGTGSLGTSVFETRTATGNELFALLTCLHTTTFTLRSLISPLEMISIKIWEWETPLSWHVKILFRLPSASKKRASLFRTQS